MGGLIVLIIFIIAFMVEECYRLQYHLRNEFFSKNIFKIIQKDENSFYAKCFQGIYFFIPWFTKVRVFAVDSSGFHGQIIEATSIEELGKKLTKSFEVYADPEDLYGWELCEIEEHKGYYRFKRSHKK